MTNSAELHHRRGQDALARGEAETALYEFQRAVEAEPGNPEFRKNAGNAMLSLGRIDGAVAAYTEALALAPGYLPALNNLGLAERLRGDFAAAERWLRLAAAAAPDDPEVITNLGVVIYQLGRVAEAADLHRQAIARNAGDAKAWGNLGTSLVDLDARQEAIECFTRAVELDPAFLTARLRLARLLREDGRLEDAIAMLEAGLDAAPASADLYCELGSALLAAGRPETAIARLQEALQVDPAHVDTLNNLAVALTQASRLGEASALAERAAALDPQSADLMMTRAAIALAYGDIPAAIADQKWALLLQPDAAAFRSNLLHSLNYAEDIDRDEIYAEHQAYGRLFTGLAATAHANTRDEQRKLRVGYVSSDFRQHSVAFFFESLLAQHDRSRLEVVCISTSAQRDEVTERLKAQADRWIDGWRLSDDALAQAIRDNGIDLLVDLAGHTGGNRLPVFARKPAPVQVSWLGYPNTTGLESIDYRLTDAYADPLGQADRHHSEKLYRLERGFLCYRPAPSSPAVTAAPVESRGHVTFGCFNNIAKISDATLKAWARILAAVPGAKLKVKWGALDEQSCRNRFTERLTHAGIAAERVELVGHTAGHAAHLAAYGDIDIALDVFPYNGTTTTLDALWMGVPVVALAGQAHAGRVGLSILKRAGLPELVAANVDDYVAMAVKLAGDRARLTELRQGLRERLAGSPLMDGPGFARCVENAYREMWVTWCREAPQAARP